MRNLAIVFVSFLIIITSCTDSGKDSPVSYNETFESLAQHNAAPDWFQDAKFGIYFHWGVYAVPAFGSEWYPRNMHFKGNRVYNHHIETYGEPSEFGYHDFVPLFKAEYFNAGEWADLFVKAGARFAGPVAEHHDGFSMWDSDVTPWNAGDKGPQKDIIGLLKNAFDNRGLKLITTFHHARHLQRYTDSIDESRYGLSHYPLFEGMPPTSDDPELNYLYGNIPEDKWLEEVWLAKLKEVIDNYQPDIIWFDSWLDQIPEAYRIRFSTYYLNEAQKWDKEVVIVRKQDDLPLNYSVDDLEKSRKNKLDSLVWMTDETISKGSWCYTQDLKIKEYADVLHVLIDIVSKNGVLLLNISPKADGNIPNDQRQVLLSIGEWLDQFGEAIYETRPWTSFGEGPTVEPEGHFRNSRAFLNIKYSNKDIRYTTKENTLYASILGWPAGAEILLTEPGRFKDKMKIKKVAMLGSDEKISWKWKDNGLLLSIPENIVDESAVVYKIIYKEL